MRPNYYIVRKIKENSIYILILAVVLSYIIFLTWYVTTSISDMSTKTDTLKGQIADLNTRRDFITYQQSVKQRGINIDAGNTLLSQLVPDIEDFFSLIYAIDKISTESQFAINGYVLSPTVATSPLSVIVTGTGDSASFIRFLTNYNFGGGRLITIDSIRYITSYAGQTSLRVNFYSGKSATAPQYTYRFTDADRQIISRIMSKVTVEVKSSSASASTYQTKPNPF